jgi:hypothetical protein
MNAENRPRLPEENAALDSALSSVSRKLHALDIVFPQIARIRQYPHQAPQDALALASLIRDRAAALVIGADLLTIEAEKVQEARKAEQAAKEIPDALR